MRVQSCPIIGGLGVSFDGSSRKDLTIHIPLHIGKKAADLMEACTDAPTPSESAAAAIQHRQFSENRQYYASKWLDLMYAQYGLSDTDSKLEAILHNPDIPEGVRAPMLGWHAAFARALADGRSDMVGTRTNASNGCACALVEPRKEFLNLVCRQHLKGGSRKRNAQKA